MEIQEILEKENLTIPKKNIKYQEEMKKHTSFKVGGPAECLITIQTIEQLKQILKVAKENKIPVTILGNGSNILVRDQGIDGIVLKINIEKIEIEQDKDKIKIIVGAGNKLSILAQKMLQQEITGMEELSGIPGTIGGAIVMNAGAHGKEIKDIVKEIKTIDFSGNIKIFSNKEAEFEYRKSRFSKGDYIILETILQLSKGNQEEIKEKMEQYKNFRKEKQPVEYPSAGSTFKRGNDFITAALIDEAGLKGFSIGGAQIAEKHAGFIINKGNATAQDILDLVEYTKKIVGKKFGKKIELEMKILGKK